VSTLVAFQYTVLRCVPRADREEFLNIGVVLYCQQTDFLSLAVQLDEVRMTAFAPDLDIPAVESALHAIDAVCRGLPSSGPAAELALGPRFGWLCAPRSTVVRPGPIHGGVTVDPAAELASLAGRMIGSRPA
jgi:Protein of unknown function (DUF3037)